MKLSWEVKNLENDYPQHPSKPETPPKPPHRYYQHGYQFNPWRHYPTIDLTTFILRMVGVLIIFIGVIMIGFWISDLGDSSMYRDPKELYENLGNNVITIGIGGIILSTSYLIDGIAKFSKGKYETSKN